MKNALAPERTRKRFVGIPDKSGGARTFLRCLPFLFLAAVSAACAPTLSYQAKRYRALTLPFPVLQASPEDCAGRTVLLGGYLLETTNQDEATVLTVLQAPLDPWNEPGAKDSSQGRFLVRTGEFLDPEIFRKNRKLTVLGRMAGSEARPLGASVYTYPVLEAVDIHLWPRRAYVPVAPYDPYWHPYGHSWGWYFHGW